MDPLNVTSELEQFSIITAWYKVEKRDYTNTNLILEKFEVTGKYTKAIEAKEVAERQRAERTAERETERQQPRFSPEGQEYIKRTLTQAVGEASNSANRGKTLFFESTVSIREGGTTGHWLVSEIGSNNFTIMSHYNRLPVAATILFRAEISNFGVIQYTIDSFRN